jgi:hypothetical protein
MNMRDYLTLHFDTKSSKGTTLLLLLCISHSMDNLKLPLKMERHVHVYFVNMQNKLKKMKIVNMYKCNMKTTIYHHSIYA